MLVLSREKTEAVMIGHAIKVAVVDVRGNKVRLGIDAPKTIPVHRLEVYNAIQRRLEEIRRNVEEQRRMVLGPAEAALLADVEWLLANLDGLEGSDG